MSEALWTWGDFASAAGGRLVGAPPIAITGLSIDTRTLKTGQAFFAIHGERFDGHDFVNAAHASGAAIAVVAQAKAPKKPAGAVLVVDDPLAAMTRLAIAARRRSSARIVAVTGSVGKTGTKEALRLALGAMGATHVSPASFNNHWGVPFALASLPESAAYAVFEIGMNHAGEITPLTALVRPHVALVTNVAPVHIGNFSSVEEIANAKAEIFKGLEPDGVAILPRDSDHYALLARHAAAAGARIVSFGAAADADICLRAADIGKVPTQVEASVHGQVINYELGAPGMHVVQNSLGVLAAVHHLGADLPAGAVPAGAAALKALAAPKGRGQRTSLVIAGTSAILIDESYNANPVSMRAALAMLAATVPGPGGRRIAVLGDMLELGAHGPGAHQRLAQIVVGAKVDAVFACGPLMEHMWRDLPASLKAAHHPLASDLAAPLIGDLRGGDVIVIKGSLGTQMGPLVAALKKHFGASQQ
ncbi:MAG: UDP-N-acetylmuramoylalanyl-D-glutamyl-2,6-diaminopimelate--D-alanyl-D-alanine ligase [Alphaproteobacteria bacterium]